MKTERLYIRIESSLKAWLRKQGGITKTVTRLLEKEKKCQLEEQEKK